jgi:ubiquinone/menaquinone biosynthesis C-methylase UbiE
MTDLALDRRSMTLLPAHSKRYLDLYNNMYDNGRHRAWREAGAIDKGSNIVQLWTQAGGRERPHVTEIGCGEGAIANYLHTTEFYASYTGLDLSRSGIIEAQSRALENATFLQVDGIAMPRADDSADLVVLSHILEHLEHPRNLIYEAARIAPWILVEVPLELHFRMPRDYVWDDLGHINKYSAKSIRQLLQTCGLEIVDQMTTNPSLATTTFFNASCKRRSSWHLKQLALTASEPFATAIFTYHCTLLARRPDRSATARPHREERGPTPVREARGQSGSPAAGARQSECDPSPP